jgi:hypothetical protein
MRASVDRSIAAAAKKQASVTVRFETGLDSILASGLIVTSAGSVLLFHYDSAPCGGANGSPRFTTEVFVAPALRKGMVFASAVDLGCSRREQQGPESRF